MFKGVIFDLDGTLLDTLDDIGNSLNLVLEEYGFKTFSPDDYKKMVGNGFRVLIERALPKDSDEDLIKEVHQKFLASYDIHYKDKSHPYAGIPELLKDLNKLNIKIGVNSNKKDHYTKALINQLFSDINFIEVVGQREGVPTKPNPDGAKIVIDKMNLNLEDIIFVGDTNVDINTGKNAHLKTIGCLWGFRDFKELKEAGADYIVSKPSEILDIIK